MVNIRQYRKGHWQLSGRYEGKRFFIQKGGDGKPITSENQAHLWRAKIESMIQQGTFLPEEWSGRNPWRFDIAIEKWIKTNPSESGYKENRIWSIKKFHIPYFGQKDFRKLTDSDITGFYRYLKSLTYRNKPYSEARIKVIMSELKGFLLSQKHLFPRFPEFPKIKIQLPVIQWINEKQQNEIFEFIDEADKPIFTFLRYTGARPSEACGLLKENVYADKGYFVLATAITGGKIRLTTKTKIARSLPIIDEIKECFHYKDESKLVFSTSRGKPYNTRILYDRWKRANKKAHEKYGTPLINLYNGLKHSFGMQRLAMGYTMDQLQAIFGHTDGVMTRRYAQYLPEALADAMSGRSPKVSHWFTEITTENDKKNKEKDKTFNIV